MECICNIIFEDPFWIALFEIMDEDGYRVTRHVFGALPNEAELIQFAKNEYYQLNFSQSVEGGHFRSANMGFKRRQREARQFLADPHHPKYAWAVLSAELEQRKDTRRHESSEEKEAAKREEFLARQQRKKEKKRGH